MNVEIYTDGAARGNPDGPGGYGVVLHYTDTQGNLHEKELSQELLKFLEKEGEERRNFYAVSVESTGEKDYKAVLDFSTKRSDGKNISITFENGIYTFAFK